MRNSTNTISMFATANPTDKWVVCIDDFFAYADTKQEAEAIYNMIMDKNADGYIDNTEFGSIQVLPPGHVPQYINGWMPAGGIIDVTTRRPIDLIGYITKTKNRRYYPSDRLGMTTPSQRLLDAKLMAGLFGEDADWRLSRTQ